MHIIAMAEGYADNTGLDKFEKDWHGKLYANGKAKLRVREVKLYTFAINEIGRDEFLSDLKGLLGDINASGGNGADGAFRWDKLTSWLRTFGRMFGIKKVDDTNIIPNPVGIAAGQSGWNMHLSIIGEVKDHKRDGVEQV